MTNEQNIKNKDLKEEKNKVWVGEDRIIYVEVNKKHLSEEDVWKLFEDVKEVLSSFPGKAKVLISIKTLSIIRSSQFRKKTAESIKDITKDLGYDKLAIYGRSILMNTIASFILVASGVKNAKVFNTEKKALKWLKKP